MLKEEKKYCVYEHTNAQTKQVFYIGIGLKNRPRQAYKRSERWKNYANKYGFEWRVLFEGINWQEACEHEKRLIKEIGRCDYGTGPLINMTDGGDGAKGYEGYWKGKKRPEVATWLISNYRPNYKDNPMPQEIRDKIARSLPGGTISDSTREKLRERIPWNKGKKYSMPEGYVSKCRGRKMPEKTLLALKKANTGRKASEHFKKRMSELHKGKIISEDMRARISSKLKEFNKIKNANK